MDETKKRRLKTIAAAVLLLVGNVVFFLTLWLLQKYDRVYFDQFLYQLKTSSAGTPSGLASDAVVRIGVFSAVAMFFEILLYLFLSGGLYKKLSRFPRYIRYCRKKLCRFFHKRVLPIALSVLVVSVSFFVARLDVIGYVCTVTEESDFIEEHYVDPESTELIFSEEKRNLIYIFLESMECTFGEPSAGGKITEDLIPELSLLADENVSFSKSGNDGGMLTYSGTAWTAASMVAQTAGVTVKVPFGEEDYGEDGSYLPGIVTLGDILEVEGYVQTLILGSDADFACRDDYFTNHGNYEILDVEALKAAGRLPEDYDEWWGFEDEKLFAFAKEELTRLGDGDAPFNLTLLTADTHFPDGYACSKCGDAHEEQYANVLSCASRQVADFLSWVKEQPFYENTTIVLCGDHLTMDPEFLEGIDDGYVRTNYNCIINAALEPVREENRLFAAFDMLPTTLAAMGVEIAGDRLALGTNLFSDVDTLTERYGYDFLDDELLKESEYYNTKFFGE